MSDLCSHQEPRRQCARCRRARLLEDIAVVVDELFGSVTTREKVPPAAVPTYRPPKDGRPIPKHIDHRTEAAGLIHQLEEAAGVRPTRASYTEPTSTLQLLEAGPTRGPRYGGDVTTGSKPGSRPPASLDSIDTLARIDSSVRRLRIDADTMAGLRTLPKPRPLRAELRHLTWLLETAHPDGRPVISPAYADKVLRTLRSHAAEARVTLSYLAPIATLNVRCPVCITGELQVRADATSDVWCIGRLPVEGPALPGRRTPIGHLPCGARWSRFTWVQLFDEAQRAAQLVSA